MVFFSAVRTKSRLHRTRTSDSLSTTMSTASSSSSDSRPSSRYGYDTGFPDSFAQTTTSMRHPDAVVDPGFSISSEDIDPSKTFSRSRRSFLAKHRRTISHGRISQTLNNQQYNLSTLSVLPPIDSAVDVSETKAVEAPVDAGPFQNTAAESVTHGDKVPLTAADGYKAIESSPNSVERRRSKLRKWRD
ncbi:hypothetical protein GGR56DRAFT_572811 [Xylariaceae sp. FL0804]|nr:hypothetical protein GGR56DRAFT_572811 [Xylariaceae sp. FL0804]